MTNFKNRPVSELSIEELRAELARREAQANVLCELGDMEVDGERVAADIKEAVLRARIDALPPEDAQPKKCPRCGRDVPVRTRMKRRTLRTLSGKLTLVRNYHYCGKCRRGFYPRDIELGLPQKGRVSPELERRILDFAINDPFEHAAERWGLHYGWSISGNLLRRVTDRVGERAEQCHARHLQHALQPPARTPAERIIVENDGSMLPIRGNEPWKEAKLAMVTRADKRTLGRHGHRGMISDARYTAVVGGVDELAHQLGEALRVERAAKAAEVIWLADGAPANWRLADRLRPGCVQILDIRHAIENGVDCGKALLGEADLLVPLWQQRLETLLLRGASGVLSELMDCLDETETPDERRALNDIVRYYRSNEKRMSYGKYLEKGYPIASGAIESAHKHVLQVRMKRAGQRWSYRRARRMATLRSAYRTCGPRRLHRAIEQAARLTSGATMPQRTKRRASNR